MLNIEYNKLIKKKNPNLDKQNLYPLYVFLLRLASEKNLKRSVKKSPSKVSFSTFLQLSCSNFELGLNVNEIKFQGVWLKLKATTFFPDTIIHKLFETNSSFHVKQHPTGKVHILFFKRFLLVLQNPQVQPEYWALAYDSNKL